VKRCVRFLKGGTAAFKLREHRYARREDDRKLLRIYYVGHKKDPQSWPLRISKQFKYGELRVVPAGGIEPTA